MSKYMGPDGITQNDTRLPLITRDDSFACRILSFIGVVGVDPSEGISAGALIEFGSTRFHGRCASVECDASDMRAAMSAPPARGSGRRRKTLAGAWRAQKNFDSYF
ncbi:hypothetical protein [Burkholderia sp. BCC0044]|uniref:hypothetical protein n=1 Tax=Burkholderia sp. BCC0044 TaxID=2676295 RepID=UPI00158D4E9E|nr:hypothetical protein [Burkholderia sp. BCC0044]